MLPATGGAPVARGRGTGIEFLEALPEDGERRLMLAVLIDAIRTLTKPPRYLQKHRTWLQERTWMLANDESRPFSFVSICHALGLEAGYVRRRVLHGAEGPHGPARRYAAKARESWLRLAGQRDPGAQARLRNVGHAAHSGAASRFRRCGSLLLSSH
jgi:hypothetical protein